VCQKTPVRQNDVILVENLFKSACSRCGNLLQWEMEEKNPGAFHWNLISTAIAHADGQSWYAVCCGIHYSALSCDALVIHTDENDIGAD
jgi:hypothetical protein